MDEEEPRSRRDSPWLSWGLVVTAAAGSLWLASRSLEGRLPALPEPAPAAAEPEVRRERLPAERADPPVPLPRTADPPRDDPAVPAPAFEAAPVAPIEEPLLAPAPGDALLRDTIERQLAMNDLAGVQVEIAGERVITAGWLPHAEDRARVRLLVRALAPELIHEDRTVISGAGAGR